MVQQGRGRTPPLRSGSTRTPRQVPAPDSSPTICRHELPARPRRTASVRRRIEASHRSESYLRRGREPKPPEEFGVGLGDDREWFSAMLERRVTGSRRCLPGSARRSAGTRATVRRETPELESELTPGRKNDRAYTRQHDMTDTGNPAEQGEPNGSSSQAAPSEPQVQPITAQPSPISHTRTSGHWASVVVGLVVLFVLLVLILENGQPPVSPSSGFTVTFPREWCFSSPWSSAVCLSCLRARHESATARLRARGPRPAHRGAHRMRKTGPGAAPKWRARKASPRTDRNRVEPVGTLLSRSAIGWAEWCF